MAVRRDKKVDVTGKTLEVRAEIYTSAENAVEDCKHRPIRHSDYDVIRRGIRKSWHGVENYDEALHLLATGYQPTVDTLKEELKVAPQSGPRFAFTNEVQGFMPVIPLALNGLPRCMIDVRIKPMKVKVLDIYYDMTATAEKDPEDFIKAGKLLLGTVIALEKQGYRFNLYAIQDYYDCHNYANRAVDILCVKVKSSDCPIDIKRMSFPLTHPAFFRVIGFDWESKSPITRYIGPGRGRSIADEFNDEDCNKVIKTMFGNNAFYISCTSLINHNYNRKSLTEVFTNAKAA